MFADLVSISFAYLALFILFSAIIITIADVLGFFYATDQEADARILESKDKLPRFDPNKIEVPLYMDC